MGGLAIGDVRKNDTWKSSDSGQTWSLVVAVGGWAGRYEHTSVVYKNYIWIIGGHTDAGYQNDVWYGGEGGCGEKVCASNQ